MQTVLKVAGPVKVPHCLRQNGIKFIEKENLKGFWKVGQAKMVAKKQGCYILALRAGLGYTPWYVGKASREMQNECLALHKLLRYNSALSHGLKGTPVLFFIVPSGSKKKVPRKILNEMEKYIIQTARYANSRLTNKVNTKNLPNWGIEGVIRGGKGKHCKESQYFRKMLGL